MQTFDIMVQLLYLAVGVSETGTESLGRRKTLLDNSQEKQFSTVLVGQLHVYVSNSGKSINQLSYS
jgi:hypothetical protein